MLHMRGVILCASYGSVCIHVCVACVIAYAMCAYKCVVCVNVVYCVCEAVLLSEAVLLCV